MLVTRLRPQDTRRLRLELAQENPIWSWLWATQPVCEDTGYSLPRPLTSSTPSRPQSLRYLSPELLIIDELGYVPIDKAGADLLFQVISERYERGSIAITTNEPFKRCTASSATTAPWPQPFSIASYTTRTRLP